MTIAYAATNEGGISLLLPNDERLTFNPDHPRWDDIVAACANSDVEALVEIGEWEPFPIIERHSWGISAETSEGTLEFTNSHIRWVEVAAAAASKDENLLIEIYNWKPKFNFGDMVYFYASPDGHPGIYEVTDIQHPYYVLDSELDVHGDKLFEPTFTQIADHVRSQIAAEQKPSLFSRIKSFFFGGKK